MFIYPTTLGKLNCATCCNSSFSSFSCCVHRGIPCEPCDPVRAVPWGLRLAAEPEPAKPMNFKIKELTEEDWAEILETDWKLSYSEPQTGWFVMDNPVNIAKDAGTNQSSCKTRA